MLTAGRRSWSALVRALAWAHRQWRRSLQLRVVTTTALLGLVVIGLLGTYLYNEIGRSLREAKTVAAQQETLRLQKDAQSTWDGFSRESKPETGSLVDQLNLSAKAIFNGWSDQTRYVLMLRQLGNGSSIYLTSLATNDGVPTEAVSRSLREAVAKDPLRQQTQATEIELGGERVPAVVVGTSVAVPDAGYYDLYFFYPMAQEQQTMQLLANALSLAALVLVVLLGAVAWMVTRQVVTPVRRTAAVSERLASGKLNERMPARGTDDLALLGTSFNAMADSLQSQIRQLEGLSRVQQRFVSDVSHELRTPLTTIRMAVDLIHGSREQFDPSVARSAELLQGELDRFEDLLADLLEISRFDAGAAALDLEPVDVRSTVDKVVAAALPIARRRGSELTVDADCQPAVAEVDERRVERVLRNLVVNAVEHGEGGPVTVFVAADEDAVAVVVEDHGVGLGPGEASLVFNRFWRADPARARTTGGTGLGLSIALEDARLHHGWLQAWGEPGRGSRFRLTLPRRGDHTLVSSPLPLARAGRP